MKKAFTLCLIPAILLLLQSACNVSPTVAATRSPSPQPSMALTAKPSPATPSPTVLLTPASVPLPALALHPGDFYFSEDGKQSFIFSRNVAGSHQQDYSTFLDWAKSGGSKVVRIQLDSMGMGYTSTGGVVESWAAQWDKIFDTAQADGIYVLPVFSGWFDWNAGSGYSTWNANPLNRANRGPIQSPAELFQKNSAAQILWLKWMQTLVERWQGRPNILGWEIFSEVNLATGATESSGIDFVNAAASTIRAADSGRPVTASIADTGTWPDFYLKTNIDFINIHPYPPSAQLDRAILAEVQSYLDKYNRPVLIGESGLNAESPENYPKNAQIGVKHAVWAGIVSGAMNGRALYWEDSFALFFVNQGMPWLQKYSQIERPAAEFVKGVDFAGFKPLKSTPSKSIWGAAVGNETSLLGWYRDAACEPPDYPLNTLVSGQSVTIDVPGTAADWQVIFYSTEDGVSILGSTAVARKGSAITIPLPDFHDDIAFKAVAH